MGGKKIRQLIESLFHPRLVPLALLGAVMAAFGVFIPRLGFYWDDWPSIWFLHTFGPMSFIEGFADDRPLLSWVFIASSSVLGESTMAWQAFGVISRWLCALIFWLNLKLWWPDKPWQTASMALLFAIYPGFRQQFISVTYGNGFIVYSLFLSSFLFMFLAHTQRRRFWMFMVVSVLTSGVTMFISEYFFGLELLRPLLLWKLGKAETGDKKVQLKRLLAKWMPYLIIMILFLYWRLGLHPTPRGNVTFFTQISSHPIQALVQLATEISLDFYEVTLLAFLNTIKTFDITRFDPPIVATYIAITIISLVLYWVYLAYLKSIKETPLSRSNKNWLSHWGTQAIFSGEVVLLLSGWPIWLTNMHADLIFPWDRFTLPFMGGACIFVVGALNLLLQKQRFTNLALAILLGLTTGMHFHDGMYFRKEWLELRKMLWQMTWRAPGIEPGTLMITSDIYFTYYSDNSLTAPINWMYVEGQDDKKMHYLIYNVESRLGIELPSLEPETFIYYPYRTSFFKGNTSQAIVFFYDPPRCLKMLDPVFDRNLPYKPFLIPEALELSNLKWIIADPQQSALPPPEYFGSEPTKDWCYYFEKAELAAQFEDWEAVVSLGEVALNLEKKFTPETASELMPFIKGYAHLGDWKRALQLSFKAYQASEKMKNMLCQNWYFLLEDTPAHPEKELAFTQLDEKLDCGSP